VGTKVGPEVGNTVNVSVGDGEGSGVEVEEGCGVAEG